MIPRTRVIDWCRGPEINVEKGREVGSTPLRKDNHGYRPYEIVGDNRRVDEIVGTVVKGSNLKEIRFMSLVTDKRRNVQPTTSGVGVPIDPKSWSRGQSGPYPP